MTHIPSRDISCRRVDSNPSLKGRGLYPRKRLALLLSAQYVTPARIRIRSEEYISGRNLSNGRTRTDKILKSEEDTAGGAGLPEI